MKDEVDLVEHAPELRAVFDKEVAKLKKLSPPSELKADADRFIRDIERMSFLLKREAAAINVENDLLKFRLAEKGVFALSVRSRPPMSAEELARVDPPMLHPRMRATTVGVLRRAGYDVIPDEPPPAHALIMLPGVPADDDYVTVSAIFGEPTSNPAYQRGAR